MRFFILALVVFSTSEARAAAAGPAFYVGSHGWHTSIVVPTTAMPRGAVARKFRRFEFLELGWGDRAFYTARSPTAAMALRAVLVPGPSVLQVVGLHPPLGRALPWSNLVRVECTARELAQLARALGDAFAPGATALQPGLYGELSWFYPARGRYSLLNTCDTWTARMIRAGGLPVRQDLGATWSAGSVIAQTKQALVQRTFRPAADQ